MENILRRPILRVIPVGLVLIAVQRTTFTDVRPLGVAIQIVLSMTAAAGSVAGAERGAWIGFVLGAMYDLGTAAPLGQHALAYGLAGYAAGMVNAVAVDPHWWLSLLFVSLGATVGEVMLPVIEMFVTDSGWQGQRLGRILPVIAVSSACLSPLFRPLGRWSLAIRKPIWRMPKQ